MLLRKLGFCELRMHLLHQHGAGTTQGALHLRVEGIFDHEKIRNATNQLIKTHPSLLNCITEHNDEYYFSEPSGETDNSNFLVIRDEQNTADSWQTQLDLENNNLLDSSHQLWKLVVIPYQDSACWDIILVMHHALMDAAGTEFLLDDFFTLLSGEQSRHHTSKQLNIFPALEEQAMTTCTWEKFAEIQSEVKQSLSTIKLQQHLSSSSLEDRTTKVQYFQIDSSSAKRLTELCDREQTSLNSLFSSLLLQAISANTTDRDSIALFSAVSLRALCPDVEERSLGCYLSVMPTIHSIQDTSAENAISLSKEHKIDIQRSFLKFGRWVPDNYDTQIVESMIKKAANSNSFDNDIGFTYAASGLKNQYRDLQIKHQYVISRRNIGNVAAILHGLMYGDSIYFTLSHVEPLQSSAWATSVKESFIEQLLSLAECA